MKACVEHGLGVAISSVSFDPKVDRGLRAVDARHLFEPSTIFLSACRGNTLNPLLADFIEMFAPHLDRASIAESLWGGAPLPAPVELGAKRRKRRTA